MSLVSIVVMTVVVFVVSITFRLSDHYPEKYEEYDFSHAIVNWDTLAEGLTLFVFAFGGHSLVQAPVQSHVLCLITVATECIFRGQR